METRNITLLALAVTIVLVSSGGLSILFNPITEGHDIELKGVDFTAVGDFLSVRVYEIQDREISDDIRTLLTTLQNNETIFIPYIDFQEVINGGIEVEFDVECWEYMVGSPLYKINNDVTHTIELVDVNITVSTGIVEIRWLSAEYLAKQQFNITVFFVIILSFPGWVLVMLRYANDSIQKDVECEY